MKKLILVFSLVAFSIAAQDAPPFIHSGPGAAKPNPARFAPAVTLTPQQSDTLLSELAGTNDISDVKHLRVVIQINGSGTNRTVTAFTEFKKM